VSFVKIKADANVAIEEEKEDDEAAGSESED
jgi:hypothetical protein